MNFTLYFQELPWYWCLLKRNLIQDSDRRVAWRNVHSQVQFEHGLEYAFLRFVISYSVNKVAQQINVQEWSFAKSEVKAHDPRPAAELATQYPTSLAVQYWFLKVFLSRSKSMHMHTNALDIILH